MSNRVQTQALTAVRLTKETLDAVFQKGEPADRFLKQYFRAHHEFGGRDRRLYSGLVFAVFRWYGALHKNFASREPEWYLAGAMAAEGMVDPVREFYPAGSTEGETPLQRLNSFFNSAGSACVTEKDFYPEWFFDHLDFEPTQLFYELEQTRPPLWLRIQRGEFTLPEAEAHPVVANARMIRDPHINLMELPEYKKRQIEVQDLSSQCIGLTCSPKEGELWWDACAGGGGKAMQLASILHGKGRIIASDIRTKKLDELRKRASDARFSNIRTQVWNGNVLPEKLQGACDGVLVDAPCSSSGRWRRNPESRWTLTEDRIFELAQLQHDILSAASAAVRPGGVLIYATCSLFKEENRMNAERFLKEHPEFQLEAFPHPLTGKMCSGQLQILPEDGDCDAAFMARFRRKE